MENNQHMTFASIAKVIESNIILPTEARPRGREYINWGANNDYPDYLVSLVDECPTLKSIITGNVDFILGDGVRLDFGGGTVNRDKMTDYDFIKLLAVDEEIFGGFAFEVIRDMGGRIAELRALDFRFVRTNERHDVFFYNERFGNSYTRTEDTIVLPSFFADPSAARSVVYVSSANKHVYPAPRYGAAIRSCEIERNITNYHINALENGFAGSYVVNFNNGAPATDEIRQQVEKDFNEKFCGSANAGRVAFSWNNSKESAVTLEKVDVTDFGEKYKSLADHSRQQIFVAFRAIPAIFGLMTESTGFNSQEFEQAFKLYNRTQIRPTQRLFVETFEKVLGVPGVLQIKPFTLDGFAEQTIK